MNIINSVYLLSLITPAYLSNNLPIIINVFLKTLKIAVIEVL